MAALISQIGQTYPTLESTDLFEGQRPSAGMDGSFQGNILQLRDYIRAQTPTLTANFTIGATNISGNGVAYKFLCNQVHENNLGGYSALTGDYVVPQSGVYFINCFILAGDIRPQYTSVFLEFTVNAIQKHLKVFNGAAIRTNANEATFHTCAHLALNEGDVLAEYLTAFGDGQNLDIPVFSDTCGLDIHLVR